LYLTGYLEASGRASYLPEAVDDMRVMLNSYLLERALVELDHELTQRLDWARIPLQGILDLLASK
jgi:maltose alpha-D-glucosyltransferase / alpha-amylase